MPEVLVKVRKMGEELKPPDPSNKEVRIGVNAGSMVFNRTLLPKGRVQNEHMHLFTREMTYVASGQVESLEAGVWKPVYANQAVVSGLGDYHNMRGPLEGPAVAGDYASPELAADLSTPKWIDPRVDLGNPEFTALVLGNDWYGTNFVKDPKDLISSPALRLDGQAMKDYRGIIERNMQALRNVWPAEVTSAVELSLE